MRAFLLAVSSILLFASIALTAGAQLRELPWPTKDAEKQTEPPAPEPEPTRVERPSEANARSVPPPSIARTRPAQRWETPGQPEGGAKPEAQRSLPVLFLSLLAVGFVLFVAERARRWITSNIALSRVLGGLAFGLRVVALGLLVGIVLELIPEGQDWILWGLVVLAVVVGWSVRDLFADVVAGAVLAAERRVKKGVWVSGNGFQGTVEARSMRATWLRDGQGHRLTVPNRAMVGAPMVYDAGADAEHEVVVRLEGYQDAGKVRMALTDAILSSPWVLAGATPVVLRDPADPVVWRVRTKLLEPRFSVHFEGELLERVEDLLRYVPKPEERETVPSDLPPGS
jgi:small-conductance mechanosensitive channel